MYRVVPFLSLDLLSIILGVKYFWIAETNVFRIDLDFFFYRNTSHCKPEILGGGGALTLERGMGMCRGHDPFFQTSHRSLAYQFTVNAPLLCPLFSIFRKFLHFQPCFGQNFSSLDPNFSKFLFLKLLFFKENPLPRPYILKPAWHTSTKKVECPPGWNHQLWLQYFLLGSLLLPYSSSKENKYFNRPYPIPSISKETHGEHQPSTTRSSYIRSFYSV